MSFEALLEWNPWWRDKQILKEFVGIERTNTKKVLEFLGVREIKVLAGVRRSGKSTIFYQIIQKLIENGTNPENILYINFEDESLMDLDFDKIIELYLQNTGIKKDIYLFLDEIQYRKKWEFWLKKQYDLKKFKQIFVTGSSSSLLDSDYSTLLTGREIIFIIYPLNFKEFLSFSNYKLQKFLLKEDRAEIKRLLKQYLEFGGFPEIVLENTKKYQLLIEYYKSILNKDIILRYNINGKKLFDLAKYLISNIAQLHSYKKLSATVNLSATTISEYLDYLEQAFLLFQIPIFSYKIKDQLQYPRKIYFVDTGLANSVGFKFDQNYSKLIENLVAVELKGKEIYYWRDYQQREVDFVIKEGIKVKQLIQVCYSLENEETRKREIMGLLKASEELKCNNLLIISLDEEEEVKQDNKIIKIIPLWKWLLESS